ncbi:uncharacterized protein [Haliotis cracherodii]|uniref:uncharacterized protein n=1 Tax=Haliotis cracherodii TaxID=6455 RepID=UPI0039E84D92
MPRMHVTSLVLLIIVLTVQGLNVTHISCGNYCDAMPGRAYQLSCSWNKMLSSGIIWAIDEDQKLVCDKNGTCECINPDKGGYSGSYYNNSAKLVIQSFDYNKHSGLWKCQDGSGPPKSCYIHQRDIGTLQGTCETHGGMHNVSCFGVSSRNTFPLEVEIKSSSGAVIAYGSGPVNSVQPDRGKETYNCTVSGEATECLKVKHVTIKCESDIVTSSGPKFQGTILVIIAIFSL